MIRGLIRFALYFTCKSPDVSGKSIVMRCIDGFPPNKLENIPALYPFPKNLMPFRAITENLKGKSSKYLVRYIP